MNPKRNTDLSGTDATESPAANDNAAPPTASFRLVIESEPQGIEYRGWSGISRERAEKLAGLIDIHAHASETIGRLPRRDGPPAILFGARARSRGRK